MSPRRNAFALLGLLLLPTLLPLGSGQGSDAAPEACFRWSPEVPRPLAPVLLDASCSTGAASHAWDLDGDGVFETATGSAAQVAATMPTAGPLGVGLRVEGADGRGATLRGVVMTNAPPTLRWAGEEGFLDGGVQPAAGTTADVFRFRVAYEDADDPAPANVALLVDGAPIGLAMEKVADEGAGRATYGLGSAFAAGIHRYAFAADDGHGATRSPLEGTFTVENATDLPALSVPEGAVATSGPSAEPAAEPMAMTVNAAPSLGYTGEENFTSDGVHPDVGNTTETFRFEVRYTDPDGTMPQYVRVRIDGDPTPRVMQQVGGTLAGGATFRHVGRLLDGPHAYRFEANDGTGEIRFPPTGAFAVTATAPLATRDYVTNGDFETNLTGWVRSGPTACTTARSEAWRAGGTSSAFLNNLDALQACLFYTQVYRVPFGSPANWPAHPWRFRVEGDFYAPSGQSVLRVAAHRGDTLVGVLAEAPLPSSPGRVALDVAPPAGTDLRITISAGPASQAFLDLVSVRLYSTPPAAGFTGEPGFESATVRPRAVNVGSPLEMRVLVHDGEPFPANVTLVAMGPSGTSRSLLSALPGNFSTGVPYALDLTPPLGHHSYHYLLEDGVDNWTWAPADAWFLVNQPPTLAYAGGTGYASDGADPDRVDEGNATTFRIRYHDDEGTAPTRIVVVLDGVAHALQLDQGQLPADGTYSTSLPLTGGNHSYHFEAGDGIGTARAPQSGGLSVSANWIPRLAYTGEANYTADGAHPESVVGGESITFRVRHTDRDAGAGSYVRVRVGATAYPMTATAPPVEGSAVYAVSLALPNGTHAYRFEAGDGEATAFLPVNGTHTVAVNHPPRLAYAGGSGYETDGAHPNAVNAGNVTTFRVRYSDAEGTEPEWVRLHLDGGTPIAMTPGAGTITGGRVYETNLTLTGGPHSYHFTASDRIATARLPAAGAHVLTVNRLPVLAYAGGASYGSDGADPDVAEEGNATTFRVTYADADGTPPTSLRLRFGNGTSHAMPWIGGSNDTGATYELRLVLPGGNHTYHFEAADANATARLPETGELTARVILLPRLSLYGLQGYETDGADPNQVNELERTRFRILYTDKDGPVPLYVHVVFNNVTVRNMSRLEGDVATTGLLYGYSTVLNRGNHSYHFRAYDGEHLIRYPATGFFMAHVNPLPTLSTTNETGYMDDGAHPDATNLGNATAFRVKFTDRDGALPKHVRLHVEGQVAIPMQWASGSNATGAIYRADPVLPAGTHAYWFEAADANATTRLPANGTYSTRVNLPPALWPANFSGYEDDGRHPGQGDNETTFTFRVNYTDPEGLAPGALRLMLDGDPVGRDMLLIGGDPGSNATYQLSTTLPGGAHSYFFAAADPMGLGARAPATGSIGFTVNWAPTLTFAGGTDYAADGVHPNAGSDATPFEFRVRYQDLDGVAPEHVRVVFADQTTANLTAVPGSGTPAAGMLYGATLTRPAGNHAYVFHASDGQRVTTFPASPLPHPVNARPRLEPTGGPGFESDGVDPDVPRQGAPVAFRMRYVDSDGTPPAYVRLVLDGLARDMVLVSGTPADGLYEHADANGLGVGVHAYFVEAGDGAATTRHPETGTLPLRVSRAPTLRYTGEPGYVSDGASREAATEGEDVTFRIHYSDPDGDAPAYVRLLVDGQAPRPLAWVSGSNATGAIYAATVKLPQGTSRYTFEASDGGAPARHPLPGDLLSTALFEGWNASWVGWRVASLPDWRIEHGTWWSVNAPAAVAMPYTPGALRRDVQIPLEGRQDVMFRFYANSEGSAASFRMNFSSGEWLRLELTDDASGTTGPRCARMQTSAGETGPILFCWSFGYQYAMRIRLDPADGTARFVNDDGSTTGPIPLPATGGAITALAFETDVKRSWRSSFAFDDLRVTGRPAVRVNAIPYLSYPNATGFDDGVEPGAGLPGLRELRVRYADPDGTSTSTRVYARIDGDDVAMTMTEGDLASGATFSLQTELAAGSHAISFWATDGERSVFLPDGAQRRGQAFLETWQAGAGNWSVEAAGPQVDCTDPKGCALAVGPACCGRREALRKDLSLPLDGLLTVEFDYRQVGAAAAVDGFVEVHLDGGGHVNATFTRMYGAEERIVIASHQPSAAPAAEMLWKKHPADAWLHASLQLDSERRAARLEVRDATGALTARSQWLAIPAAAKSLTRIVVGGMEYSSTDTRYLVDNVRVGNETLIPVNTPPVLSPYGPDAYAPASRRLDEFRIGWNDADGHLPKSIRVHVDGDAGHDMPFEGPLPVGRAYVWRGSLPNVPHTYHFEASDGMNVTRYPAVGELSTANFYWDGSIGNLQGWNVQANGAGPQIDCAMGTPPCSFSSHLPSGTSYTATRNVQVDPGLVEDYRFSFKFRGSVASQTDSDVSVLLGYDNGQVLRIEMTYATGNYVYLYLRDCGEQMLPFTWRENQWYQITYDLSGRELEIYDDSGTLVAETGDWICTPYGNLAAITIEGRGGGSPVKYNFDNILLAGISPGRVREAPALSYFGGQGFTADGAEPEAGLTTTDFKFRVKYTSPRGLPPTFVRVWTGADGHGAQGTDMVRVGGDPVNGEYYEVTRKVDRAGHQPYRFYASDGASTVWWPPFSTFMVAVDWPPLPPSNNKPLSLRFTGEPGYESDAVEPLADSPGTYRFRIRYSDPEGVRPGAVWLVVDGAMHYMIPATGSTDYVNGVTYFLDVPLPDGPHSYRVWGSDEEHKTAHTHDTVWFDAPLAPAPGTPGASNVPPVVSFTGELDYQDDGHEPIVGQPGAYEFRVLYRDADGKRPTGVFLHLDGQRHTMAQEDTSEDPAGRGLIHVFRTPVSPGNHEYWFTASDGLFLSAPSSTRGFAYVPGANQPPILSDGSASPAHAGRHDTVVVLVTYKDLDGDAPRVRLLLTQGSTKHPPIAMTCGQGDPRNGVACWANLQLAEEGTYQYHFEANDGEAPTRLPKGVGEAGAIVIAGGNGLYAPAVSLAAGTTEDEYVFRATYRHADGAPARNVHLLLRREGEAQPVSYRLVPAVDLLAPVDRDAKDGIVYELPLRLRPGTYRYAMTAEDATRAYTLRPVEGGEFAGPAVVRTGRLPSPRIFVSDTTEGASDLSICSRLQFRADPGDAPWDGDHYSYTWNFHDGMYAYTKVATHSWGQAFGGFAKVTLEVSDDDTRRLGLPPVSVTEFIDVKPNCELTPEAPVEAFIPPGAPLGSPLATHWHRILVPLDAVDMTIRLRNPTGSLHPSEFAFEAAPGVRQDMFVGSTQHAWNREDTLILRQREPVAGDWTVRATRLTGPYAYEMTVSFTFQDRPSLDLDFEVETARAPEQPSLAPYVVRPPVPNAPSPPSVPQGRSEIVAKPVAPGALVPPGRHSYYLETTSGTYANPEHALATTVPFQAGVSVLARAAGAQRVPYDDFTVFALSRWTPTGADVWFRADLDDMPRLDGPDAPHLRVIVLRDTNEGELREEYVSVEPFPEGRWAALRFEFQDLEARAFLDDAPIGFAGPWGNDVRIAWQKPRDHLSLFGPLGSRERAPAHPVSGAAYLDDVSFTPAPMPPRLVDDFEDGTQLEAYPSSLYLKARPSTGPPPKHPLWHSDQRGYVLDATQGDARAIGYLSERGGATYPVDAVAWVMFPSVVPGGGANPITAMDVLALTHRDNTSDDVFRERIRVVADAPATAGATLRVETEEGGAFTVPGTLSRDEWHEIHLHITEKWLFLYVDGRVAPLCQPGAGCRTSATPVWTKPVNLLGPLGSPLVATGRGYVLLDDVAVANSDFDGDGVPNVEETRRRLVDAEGPSGRTRRVVVTNPLASDTDRDGVGDGLETGAWGATLFPTDPLDRDSDDDGHPDLTARQTTGAGFPSRYTVAQARARCVNQEGITSTQDVSVLRHTGTDFLGLASGANGFRMELDATKAGGWATPRPLGTADAVKSIVGIEAGYRLERGATTTDPFVRHSQFFIFRAGESNDRCAAYLETDLADAVIVTFSGPVTFMEKLVLGSLT